MKSSLLSCLTSIRSPGYLRPLVALTTHHCLDRPAFERYLSDFGLTKTALAGVCRDLYLMESLTYLTAGIYGR